MEKVIIEIEEYIRYLDWKIRRKGRGILADQEITALQFYALQRIRFQDGKATPGFLTDILQLAPSTVSDMIRKMEQNGYIEKTVVESDKRSFNIDLTDKGCKLIDSVVMERYKYLESCLSNERKEEVEKIKDALKHLYEILSEK